MQSLKRLLKLVIALVIFVAPLLVWWQWNAIYDWYRLRSYTPSSAIVELARDDTMTAKAKHLLYVNHADLVNEVDAFRADCPENEETIVLGCYHPNESGIYVYNVHDDKLEGVQQVTAAHEMLHAAYERLSDKERGYIDRLLQDYYQNDVHDKRLIDTINAYKKTEPNDVVNEMHSIFGTEIANLPQPLENYYKQYFSKRSAVVVYAAGYENQFTSRINKINAYDAQLAGLKQRINIQQQSLDNQVAQIESDRARLNSLRSSGQIQTYNAAIPGFNAEVGAYNQAINKLRNDIASFNDLVVTRNALAAELRGLDSAIDTRLTTQSTQ